MMPETHQLELIVGHANGLHLRPAALFVRVAAQFKSAITVSNVSRQNSLTVDAKSMFAVMQLGVAQGHHVEVRATGEDAAAAVLALQELVDADFQEHL